MPPTASPYQSKPVLVSLLRNSIARIYNLCRVTMFDNPTVLKWNIFNEVILKSYAFNANAHKHIPNLKRHLLDCRTLVVVGILSIG